MTSLTCNVPSRAFNGYTLFGFTEECSVWLINMAGQFVHHWSLPYCLATYGKLLSNGNLLYNLRQPPSERVLPLSGLSGKLCELDWDGNLVWEYEDPYMHHDFYRLPNGNTMILRLVPVPDDFAPKIKGGVPNTDLNGQIWTDSFQEITPNGEVVWEWLSYEHLDPEIFVCCPLEERAEWLHTNTCCVLPDGDILTVFHKTHYIAIIDKSSGKVKWHWGGAKNLGHPHDATMLDNGNVLIFDNGSHRKRNLEAGFFTGVMNFSRVLEIDPNTNKIVWEYRDEFPFNFHSSIASGCQRLPNGNTLICEATAGRIFEVTKEKEVVWEYVNPFFNNKQYVIAGFTNGVFRAYRYGPDYPGLKDKNLDPNKVELVLRESPVWRQQQDELKSTKVEERLGKLGY